VFFYCGFPSFFFGGKLKCRGTQGGYTTEQDPSKKISLSSNEIDTRVYDGPPLIQAHKTFKTKVSVVEMDCLEAAHLEVQKGSRPLVLNMASANSPGGGYRKGDGAQEENLFRRTNYLMSLDDLFGMNPGHPMYPIAEFGGIYSSNVTVFRYSTHHCFFLLTCLVSSKRDGEGRVPVLAKTFPCGLCCHCRLSQP
jgi:uncharacterized protein (TIGR02452 family)